MHIAPRTVRFLRSLGHDVIRVDERLLPSAADEAIVAAATRDERYILTQDLDFSAIGALSGGIVPSVISLRLSSSRVERVNTVLQEVRPGLEKKGPRPATPSTVAEGKGIVLSLPAIDDGVPSGCS